MAINVTDLKFNPNNSSYTLTGKLTPGYALDISPERSFKMKNCPVCPGNKQPQPGSGLPQTHTFNAASGDFSIEAINSLRFFYLREISPNKTITNTLNVNLDEHNKYKGLSTLALLEIIKKGDRQELLNIRNLVDRPQISSVIDRVLSLKEEDVAALFEKPNLVQENDERYSFGFKDLTFEIYKNQRIVVYKQRSFSDLGQPLKAPALEFDSSPLFRLSEAEHRRIDIDHFLQTRINKDLARKCLAALIEQCSISDLVIFPDIEKHLIK